MSGEDPILAELRAVTANAKAAADAAKGIAPLPKAVSDLSSRLAAVETAVKGANLGTVGSDIRTAASDVKEAAKTARQAAAEAVQAKSGLLVSWGPGAALGALLCLLAGGGGYWFGQCAAEATAGPDAAWARQFGPKQREVAAAFVRNAFGRAGWFGNAADIEQQVETATQISPADAAWVTSQQARTLRRIGELAPTNPAEGAPWPCFGWGQQTWTLGSQAMTTCVVRWK
jgi:hypothetical protein